MPNLANQLDQETLNLLLKVYSKNGLTNGGRLILDGMLQQHLWSVWIGGEDREVE